MLLVTIKEFDEINRLADECHRLKISPPYDDPWEWDDEKWIAGLSQILGEKSVSEMIGGGPYRIQVAEWLNRDAGWQKWG